jgi:hypothetical protein
MFVLSMRTRAFCAFLSLALGLVALPAVAAPRPATSGSNVSSGGNFGLGVEFGPGAGLSIKYFPSADHAFQFGLHTAGYGYGNYYRHGDGYFYHSGVYFLHGEYLKTGAREFDLPWYVGGGLDLGTGYYDAVSVGIHGNLGVALQLRSVPLDFFVEWTPRLWVTNGTYLSIGDANAGIRFWF